MAHLESRASYPSCCEKPLLHLEGRHRNVLLQPMEVVHHVAPVSHEWCGIRYLTNARGLDIGIVRPDFRGTMIVRICSEPVVVGVDLDNGGDGS